MGAKKVVIFAKVKPELVQSKSKKKLATQPSIMRGRKGTMEWRPGQMPPGMPALGTMPMPQAGAAAADASATGEVQAAKVEAEATVVEEVDEEVEEAGEAGEVTAEREAEPGARAEDDQCRQLASSESGSELLTASPDIRTRSLGDAMSRNTHGRRASYKISRRSDNTFALAASPEVVFRALDVDAEAGEPDAPAELGAEDPGGSVPQSDETCALAASNQAWANGADGDGPELASSAAKR